MIQELRWILRVRARRSDWYFASSRSKPVRRRPRQELRQGDRVLDGGIRALAVVRQHRVCGVAKDDHAPTIPVQQRPRSE